MKIPRSTFVRRRISYNCVLLREKHENSYDYDSGREKAGFISRPGFIIPVSLKVSLSSLNNEDEHLIELKAELRKK